MQYTWELRTWRHLAGTCHLPRATRAQVAGLEALLGRSLPDSVAEFLMEFNGGWLEYNFTWRHNLVVSFPQVVPVDSDWLAERLRRRAPHRHFEIASGSSSLLMDLDQEFPPLIFQPHEHHPSAYPDESAWEVASASFEEYIAGLWVDLDDHLPALKHLVKTRQTEEEALLRAWLDIVSPSWTDAWREYEAGEPEGDVP